MKVEMEFDGVLELIIRSIELEKYDNAKAIAEGALKQFREAKANKADSEKL